MTVQQLIDGLKHYDPNLPVIFEVEAETAEKYSTFYPVSRFSTYFIEMYKTEEAGKFAAPDFLILKD